MKIETDVICSGSQVIHSIYWYGKYYVTKLENNGQIVVRGRDVPGGHVIVGDVQLDCGANSCFFGVRDKCWGAWNEHQTAFLKCASDSDGCVRFGCFLNL